jgi:hypothetical protein
LKQQAEASGSVRLRSCERAFRNLRNCEPLGNPAYLPTITSLAVEVCSL